MCFYKKRPRIKLESDAHRAKRQSVTAEWKSELKPDSDGFYTCYLRISPYCPRRLTLKQITPEHVYPKNKYPALRYRKENLKVACSFCNALKLSNTVNQLCKFFPMLVEMVQQPEWQAWEDQMEEIANQLELRLDRPDPGQRPVADLLTDVPH